MTREQAEAIVYAGGGCAWCGRKVPARGDTVAPVGRRVPTDLRFHQCVRCITLATRESDVYDALITHVGRVDVEPGDVLAAVVAMGAAWSSLATPKMPGNRTRWAHITDWPVVLTVAVRLVDERARRLEATERSRCHDCGRPTRDWHPLIAPGGRIDGQALCLICAERRRFAAEREIRSRAVAATRSRPR